MLQYSKPVALVWYFHVKCPSADNDTSVEFNNYTVRISVIRERSSTTRHLCSSICVNSFWFSRIMVSGWKVGLDSLCTRLECGLLWCCLNAVARCNRCGSACAWAIRWECLNWLGDERALHTSKAAVGEVVPRFLVGTNDCLILAMIGVTAETAALREWGYVCRECRAEC